jgi:branched-chain amino acid transport system ATP-binding protein
MLLEVRDATVHYGKAKALDGVSIEVQEKTVAAIIGSNGAGKSTLLKALSGLVPLTSGEVWFSGSRIDGMAVHEIVRRGLIHIPEGRRLFPDLTVVSNLRLGAYPRKEKTDVRKDLDHVFELFPRLRERNGQKAGTLSGGEQQMLAIGRALMGKPRLLLMDEPSLGLAPIVVDELAPVIKGINEAGVGVILVEQNVPLALKVADHGYVLQTGRVIQGGPRDELEGSEAVRRAYLGG